MGFPIGFSIFFCFFVRFPRFFLGGVNDGFMVFLKLGFAFLVIFYFHPFFFGAF